MYFYQLSSNTTTDVFRSFKEAQEWAKSNLPKGEYYEINPVPAFRQTFNWNNF